MAPDSAALRLKGLAPVVEVPESEQEAMIKSAIKALPHLAIRYCCNGSNAGFVPGGIIPPTTEVPRDSLRSPETT